MYFSKFTAFAILAASAIAAPISDVTAPVKRANLLTAQPYSEFQVSSGTAGNALAEVDEKFHAAEFRANPTAVSDSDIEILKAARVTAENAETESGGYNDAIDAAGKDTAAGKALQNGKIKNKVLKLELQVLLADIQIGQGDNSSDVVSHRATELKKLNSNVATDTKNAGQASTAVDFQGSS
ncbi:hypothetical protein TD95_002332 [Thielaviopsis punctulata]|uniref:Small secreted protein n=1 Tax=Thielaviopsis punctulata TaxID=72032 RepID=A0A0F4ZGX5_9PEZI|nr:hypothetical protein TD95_002332 [Thielaviopsis punctulata]